ncbi:glycosyl hydrolase family 65 protein [soil metagenome]
MTKRHADGSELPHHIYPIDRWSIVETAYTPDLTALLETVFALGNGWLGVRGSFHQGQPSHQPGALINGYYESWPIIYPEAGYGFATAGQTIVYVPDPTPIHLAVDGETVDFDVIDLRNWHRRLDFKTGTLTHRYRWVTSSGITVDVKEVRFVSVAQRDLVVSRLEVGVDRRATVELASFVVNHQDTRYLEPAASEFDPRRAKNFGRRVLEPTDLRIDDVTMSASYRTYQSQLDLALSSTHRVSREASPETEPHPDHLGTRLSLPLSAGESVSLDVFTAYEIGSDRGIDHTETTAEVAAAVGFGGAALAHRSAWARFWETADVHIGTDKAVQQAVRWILFQLHQASANINGNGIAAKGVTGQAYEGHYFWDTEIFVLPFLIYTRPEVAASLLRLRYAMLPKARERARELSVEGALFPWRTINGTEASAYYAAGTAQYHINADIAFALRQYVEVTGDEDLLWDIGVEILVETARMWADLGFHRDGAFHIYGVTGPDEYTAIVDDNAYTNLMAQMNLLYAAESARRMRSEHPQRWSALSERLTIDPAEVDQWKSCGSDMFVGFDSGYGITRQDESFLAKERWDFDAVPEESYPLFLHYHPLVIYRYQVLKQADVVMATFLCEDRFDPDLIRANFEYYDPLTTGDSSLSACVQAIVAAQVGEADLAMRYFRTALFTDLADLHRNTTDGVHLASAGGVWMSLIYGMAGMRDRGGFIQFDPRLPLEWRRMKFGLQIRGVVVLAEIDHEGITLRTKGGESEIGVRGKRFTVGPHPITIDL